MKRLFDRTILCCFLAAATFGVSSAIGEPEWVLVKSLVVARPLPDNPGYGTTTETFMDKKSIEAAGRYRKAAFRQTAKDNTGYEMRFGRNTINWYYYDCNAGELAWSSAGIPDAAKFKSYAQHIKERPDQPHADAKVVALVCGSK